jgi:putative ABC transport system permease protein
MKPPVLPRRLLSWILPEHLRHVVIDDLDEEFRVHIAPSRSALRARAWYWRQALGSIPAAVRRRGWWRVPIAEFMRDLRHGARLPVLVDLRHLLRNLRRSPVSAAAAILTLSLTLAAGASIFAVVDAVLLTPPPFADPDALVRLGEIVPGDAASASRSVRYGTVEAWRERAGTLAAIEAADGTHLTLTELGPAERVHVTDITPGYLPLLGVAPAYGRMFEANDLSQPVVILTHTLWRTRLAADPSAIGRQIVLGGRPYTIVGVLSEQFVFPLDEVDVFRPLQFPLADLEARAGTRVVVLARLARNVSPKALTAALDEISRQSSPPAQVVATPLSVVIARGSTKTLGLLAGAAALAFLIAFANLAGLLLVRSIDRRRELAVRTALGARPSEIARQLMLEAETLVAIGVAGGLLVAVWLTPIVAGLALEQFGGVANREIALSWRVIAVIGMIAVACAGLCGLLPAIVVSRRHIVDMLSRGVTTAPRELRLRRVAVTAVVALTCVLLVSLSLVGRSLRNVLNVNPGFDARGVLTLGMSLTSATRYPAIEQVASFYATLHRALEERLGPRTVSVINELPLTHDQGRGVLRIQPTDPPVEMVRREAGTAYFDVMRIPIVAGRAFDARDDAIAPFSVVVSKSVAERWFRGEQPIGRHIRLGPGGRPAEIIGVVGDVKHRSLDDEEFLPTVYFSAWRSPSRSMFLVVRSLRAEAEVLSVVREEVARLDPDLPVPAVRSMQDVAAASPGVPVRRALTATFMGFAILATVLSAIGLFGVAAHDVAARRAELALRIALGADPRRILMRTLGQGAWLVGAGVVAGGILSIWAARALGSMTLATSGFDPLNIAAAATVLMVVGAVAVLPAARRAARTDPVEALRN